ncbi:hypothetical protein ACVWZK_003308 [Bradyrhizobium sp. GM0.4]
MPWPDPITLRGQHAALEPLSHQHREGLSEAVKDGELSTIWYTAIPTPDNMGKEIDRRLGLQAAGSMLPFTVFDGSGKIVGMTTYMNIDAANRRVEIGSTWYGKSAQRGPLNTQCKLLLLTHAFETLDCIAVEFPHPLLQSPEPPRHRAPGRQAGRHPAQPPGRAERHATRHRGLQHHRGRMAYGANAFELSTQRQAALEAAEAPWTDLIM